MPGSDMDERQRVAERTRAAMKFRHNMAQGIPNVPGMVIGNVGSMQEDQHYSFPTAEELKRRMEQKGPGMGIPNSGGFDASDLMKTSEDRQQSTADQAAKVSAPYEQANKMAAEKINPMNAESQSPFGTDDYGRAFLLKFIGK